jgi:hypothetical protein
MAKARKEGKKKKNRSNLNRKLMIIKNNIIKISEIEKTLV